MHMKSQKIARQHFCLDVPLKGRVPNVDDVDLVYLEVLMAELSCKT